MRPAVVVGTSAVWVHRRHGGWRRITLGHRAAALAAIGSATTTVAVAALMPQQVPAPDAGTPLVPRAGPAHLPIKIAGP